MNYDNFDIWIEAENDNRYRVIVLPPSDDPEYLSENILAPDILAKLTAFDKNESSQQDLKDVGLHLFTCLFRGTVLNKFNLAFGRVQDNDSMGLRIRLLISAPAIAALPWELLYDPDRNRFLATWNKTPVTRFLRISEGNRQLAINPPVRVLVAIPGVSGLNVGEEQRIVRTAFKELESKGLVQLEFMLGRVSAITIANKLNEGPPFHIFHFIGHGCFKKGEEEGYLLVNPDSQAEDPEEFEPPQLEQLEWLCADDFADLFMNHPTMKLVVLNSCKGAQVSSIRPLAGVVPKLFGREIPAVIAMQYPIFDDAALRFSSQFYRTLCKGYERGLIDAAVTSARNLMHVKARNELSFATPVLFMRSDSGAIFDLKEKGPEPIAVAATAGTGGDAIGVGGGAVGRQGIVTSLASRLWRAITAPIRLLSEAPRLRAVKDAHDETLRSLELKKGAAGSLEEVVQLEHEIEQGRLEVESINKRLSNVVRATIRITAAAFALSLIVLLASTFGLFNVVGIDDYFQKMSYSYLRSERLNGSSFGYDQIRVILVDQNNRVDGFPNLNRSDDRAYHAELINALAEAGARVVALDIFLEVQSPWDEKLATAIRQASQKGTQVIVGTVGFDPAGEPLTRVPEVLREPLKDRLGNVESAYVAAGFRPAVRAVKLGDLITSGPRQQNSNQGRSVAPSFVIEAIRQFRREPGSQPASVFFNQPDNTVRLVDKDAVFPIHVDGESMLYYFGVPDFDKFSREFAPVRSTYQDVYAKRNDPEALQGFRGKMVMVGYQVDQDMHYVNGVRRMPGVEIQAAVASNILQGVHLQNLSRFQNYLVILTMAALGWALQSARLRRFSIQLPFESRVLKKLITIPVPLLIVTLLYLVAIYFIYSRTSWVVDMTYHIAALFFSYWTAGLIRETRSNSFASLSTAQAPNRKDVIKHA